MAQPFQQHAHHPNQRRHAPDTPSPPGQPDRPSSGSIGLDVSATPTDSLHRPAPPPLHIPEPDPQAPHPVTPRGSA